MKKKMIKPKKFTLPLKKMSAKEKDYVGGLMENYNGNLTAIFEVLGDLRDKYDMHTEMIGSLMVGMTTVKSDIVEIKSDIVEIKGDIKVINGRLDRIEQAIKEMREEIKELKNVLKNKADIQRVELLESRLYRVEERLKSPV